MTTPIALITGGNRGLGRSAALALAKKGTDVVLTYRGNAQEAAGVVQEIEALAARRRRCSWISPRPPAFPPSSPHCARSCANTLARSASATC